MRKYVYELEGHLYRDHSIVKYNSELRWSFKEKIQFTKALSEAL